MNLRQTPLSDLIDLTNGALKQYQSVLALARSPLADSALVHPLLVRDDVSPTADERGHALRLLLQWAVSRLAPAPARYPLGVERPYDDPTWRDPLWWRYNILRHRYLEPLHPDEFVDGGRFTETLLALTGITSTDAFFDERNRAIREVAQRLRELPGDAQANAELESLALEEALHPLHRQQQAMALLGIAATFDDVFPRTLLLQMARDEQITDAPALLEQLTADRYLLMGEGGLNLWLSPVLQSAVYVRQPEQRRRHRHRFAAHAYRREDATLDAANHAIRAQEWTEAATWLLHAAPLLIADLQTEELLALLTQIPLEALPSTQWCELQLLCCDLYRRHGEQDAALAACRAALRVAPEDSRKGELYWRIGKLYEKRNVIQALGYYEEALNYFPAHALPVAEVRKDRAWLHLFRHEWDAAASDLHHALSLVTAATMNGSSTQTSTDIATHTTTVADLHANILDALAHLHLEQQHFDNAIDYARQALHLREATGDRLQIAKSFNNLGNFYSRMGEVDAAIAAHEEALQFYKQVHNQALTAETWLNQGVVFHSAGRQREAILRYHNSLALSQPLGLTLTEITAHANLLEAHAELGEREDARRHWHFGHALSVRANADAEQEYFEELQTRFGLLPDRAIPKTDAINSPTTMIATATPRALLTPELLTILTLAERKEQITPKAVMAECHVSKATATRRLTELTEAGRLVRRGKGRATVYLPADMVQSAPTEQQPMARKATSADVTAQAANRSAFMAQLAPYHTELCSEYRVTLLYLLIPRADVDDETHSTIWQLGIDFLTLPSLTEFFALERQLRAWSGEPIDLLPVAVMTERQLTDGVRLI